MTDSARLLKRYLESGCSRDFEILVKQYYGLVFGTAFRSTQSRALAEEVTQEAFIILARKAASIRESDGLASWLHRTATQCAMNMNRKEARRRKAMQSYSDEVSGLVFSSPQEELNWRKAVPMLDKLIEELPGSDREAIILRFYEERSFKVIGSLTGKSEEASRKKVNRAVEKLSALFKKRRIVVGSSALLASLSPSLKAEALAEGGAFSELARLAVESKASTSLGATTQILAMMSGYKCTIAAASLLLLIPPGLQWQENRDSVRSQKNPAAHLESDHVRSQSTGLQDRTVPTTPRSQEELLRALSLIPELPTSFEREAQAEHFVLSLQKGELHSMLAVLQGDFPEVKELSESLKSIFWDHLFIRWVRLDSSEAVAVARELQGSAKEDRVYHGIVKGWAGRDPVATEDLILSLPPGDLQKGLMRIRWLCHAKERPEEALQMALNVKNLDERTAILEQVLRGVEDVDPLLGLSYVEKLEEGFDKQRWLSSLVEKLAATQPQEAFSKVVESSDKKLAQNVLPKIMKRWASRDFENSFKALSTLDEERRHDAIFTSYGYGLADIKNAEWALQQLQDESEKGAFLSGVVSAYETQATYFHPPTSQKLTQLRELVESLPEGASRSGAEWDFATLWALRNSAEANDWIQQSSSIDEKMKDKFTRYYHETD